MVGVGLVTLRHKVELASSYIGDGGGDFSTTLAQSVERLLNERDACWTLHSVVAISAREALVVWSPECEDPS